MSEFKDNLKKLRTQRSWSQDRLADELGVTRSAIGNYEQGTRVPDLEMLLTMTKVFEVDIEYLVGGEEASRHRLKSYADMLFANTLHYPGADVELAQEQAKKFMSYVNKFSKMPSQQQQLIFQLIDQMVGEKNE